VGNIWRLGERGVELTETFKEIKAKGWFSKGAFCLVQSETFYMSRHFSPYVSFRDNIGTRNELGLVRLVTVWMSVEGRCYESLVIQTHTNFPSFCHGCQRASALNMHSHRVGGSCGHVGPRVCQDMSWHPMVWHITLKLLIHGVQLLVPYTDDYSGQKCKYTGNKVKHRNIKEKMYSGGNWRKLSTKSNSFLVRFEAFMAVTMKKAVFLDIKPQFVLHRRHITSPLQSPAS
jgi:hypothetical protein